MTSATWAWPLFVLSMMGGGGAGAVAAGRAPDTTFNREAWARRDGAPPGVSCLTETRDGWLWLGSPSGLVRFDGVSFERRDLLAPSNPASRSISALLATRAGDLWVAYASGTTRRLVSGDPVRIEFSPGLPAGFAVTAFTEDGNGTVRATTARGVFRLTGNAWVAMPDAPVLPADGGATLTDREGNTWIGTGDGLERFRRNVLTPASPGDDTFASARRSPAQGANVSVKDAAGNDWLGFADNRLDIVEGSVSHRYTAANGLETGTVVAILPGTPAIVGGERGVAAFDGRRFHMLATTQPDGLAGVTGLLRDSRGNLWIHGASGALQVTATELAAAVADPAHPLSGRLFGRGDGMPGGARSDGILPTMLNSDDGRIWFAGTEGVAWIDPSTIPPLTNEPHVVISSVTVAGEVFSPHAPLSLVAGTTRLRIVYTALGLRAPELAAFRYRLDGVDKAWQYPGSRRAITYSNLGPGTYRFHVTVADDGGRWQPAEETMVFIIRPFFFQTRWFAVCVGLLILLALVGLSVWRTRRVAKQERQQLEIRHAERDRIGHELNDTFLQTVQGLTLLMHASAQSLPEGRARDRFVQAIASAECVLEEGRNRITQLTERKDDADL
jgi:ligand-binding sensor domain-containing protein